MRILLVEADTYLALTIKDELSRNYVVEIAANGKQAQYQVEINTYDLLILDWMLPDISGLELISILRKNRNKVPILMLTTEQGQDKITALDTGADGYLTKPFKIEELKAMLRALLRRSSENFLTDIITVADLTIDLTKNIVKRGGKVIPLRRKEFCLLEYLARNAGRIITRDMILENVWDSETEPIANTIDVHIKYLRDKIDKNFDKKLIKTVYGLGYKLEA